MACRITIKEFIIIQKKINTFKFQIVGDEDLSQADKQAIIDETSRYLEPGLYIEFEMCKQIGSHHSGKSQHFFSEIVSEYY